MVSKYKIFGIYEINIRIFYECSLQPGCSVVKDFKRSSIIIWSIFDLIGIDDRSCLLAVLL